MQQYAFCTITTRSHLKYAIALGKGLERSHPNSTLCVLAVDFNDDVLLPRPSNIEFISLDELRIPEIDDMKIYFNAFELSNALKPFLLHYLLRKRVERAIYLDADIFVVGKFDLLLEMLDRHSFVLSPHWLYPEASELSAAQVPYVANYGVYNGGLWGVKKDENGLRVLQWLMRFLPQFGFDDPLNGMFVDQKLLPLVIQLYHLHFGCIDDAGYNVAYWNLHERTIRNENAKYYVNGRPVVFFHMSGFRTEAPAIFTSRSPQRFDLPIHMGIIHDYMSDIPVVSSDLAGYSFNFAGSRKLSPEMRRYYFKHRTFEGYRATRWRHAFRQAALKWRRIPRLLSSS